MIDSSSILKMRLFQNNENFSALFMRRGISDAICVSKKV